MKNKLILIGGALLVVASLYPIIQQHHHTHVMRAKRTPKEKPDLIVLNSTTYRYNKEGLLKDEIFAEKTLHYNEDNLTVVIKPKMTLYTEKRIPWTISADTGRSLDGDKVFYLTGHVRLYQASSPGSPETTITTTALTYYPRQSVAITAEEVTIIQPRAQLLACGMRVNLKKGILTTRSKTRATYDPN